MGRQVQSAILAAAAAVILLSVGFVSVPPVSAHPPSCPEGLDSFTEYRLFFGRNDQDREVVSDAAWRDFLATEITPRFPDGLTVMDAAGQWRDGAGTLIRERSKMVLILAVPGSDGGERVDAIIAAYKDRFDQESVLRVIGNACVAF
ncbi:MAG: DUF3574 domain-containing protein [Pseudomonadota bacterium]